MVGSHNVSRAPVMMENVSASRFLSTPRDEHYPRSHNNQARAQKKTNKSVDPTYATTENVSMIMKPVLIPWLQEMLHNTHIKLPIIVTSSDNIVMLPAAIKREHL